MGDRANVYVKDGESGTYLYTHWSGTELPQILATALRRGRGRWDDGQYLARIIFCQMIKGAESEATGYGISANVVDGDDRIIVVDPGTQLVWYEGDSNRYRFEDFKGAVARWPS